jgi:hypothetical protein
VVLGERAKQSSERPQTRARQEDLGSILDRLAANLSFPAAGRARYQIRETGIFLPEPRLLKCTYAFSGVRYAFEVAEEGAEHFDQRSYFNGDRSVRWEVRNDVATVWEGRRERRPIYRLDRFWRVDVVDDLLGHDVEFLGTGDLDGEPCWLITSTLSSKDKLKVWLSQEPAVFPLRIERYEHDHLRYLYEAREITTSDGAPFPKEIREASYRWDEATGLVPTGSYEVTIESFEPDVSLAVAVFTPDFSSQTTVSIHRPVEPEASAFEPTTPARRIQNFRDIAIRFDLEQARGEAILVCFFDLNQRPARRCVIQLAGQTKKLQDKGVQVVAVQVPHVAENELDAWITQQKVPFPVGKIEANIEKVKSSWGVNSLPWLILTNRTHQVIAEGFLLDELDTEIRKIRN